MFTSMHNLALTYGQKEKFTEAAKTHEEALAKRQAILVDDHLDTFTSIHNLAETYGQQGKLTEAAKMHEEVLAKNLSFRELLPLRVPFPSSESTRARFRYPDQRKAVGVYQGDALDPRLINGSDCV